MNKTELIRAIAEKTGNTQKDTKVFIDALQEVTFETLKSDEVKLMDGVTLYSVYKEAHEARNPQTGETVMVDGKYLPKVKLGKAIKDAVL